jgi:TetR/AcrR family transcriptional regulator, ethionamide resistance regulator
MSPLSRRTERSRPGRRSAVQDRLLGVLERQLEQGVSLASVKVDDLVAEAGISRATFYIHFHDKVDLLEEWLIETRKVLFEVSDAWYSAPSPTNREELAERLRAIVAAYRERLTLMAAMHETALYDATLRAEFAEAFEAHFAALTAHVEAGQRDGTVRAELSPRETAEWLVCLMERVPMQINPRARRREVESHVEALAGVIWSTLYARAA